MSAGHIGSPVDYGSALAEPLGIADTNALEGILRVTRELFPGDVKVSTTEDPEHPGDTYIVVSASASGEITGIEDRRVEWHKRVTELSLKFRLLRLSLDYQP
jgi:hypothetical protein